MVSWSDLKPWISKLAPMIGAAVGGPLGGAAGALLGDALGIKDATPETIQKAIQTGSISGDQIVLLKQAEQRFTLDMAALDINSVKDMEELAVMDRKYAREREISTGDWTPKALGFIVTGGFFGLLFYLLKWEAPSGSRDILNILLGALATAWISVITYYFGSSAGSARKDVMINK